MSGTKALDAGPKAGSKSGGQQNLCRWSSLSFLLSCPYPGHLPGYVGYHRTQSKLQTHQSIALFLALFLDRNQAEEQRLWSFGAVQGSNQLFSLSSPQLAPYLPLLLDALSVPSLQLTTLLLPLPRQIGTRCTM